jgi:hypothetical protein
MYCVSRQQQQQQRMYCVSRQQQQQQQQQRMYCVSRQQQQHQPAAAAAGSIDFCQLWLAEW